MPQAIRKTRLAWGARQIACFVVVRADSPRRVIASWRRRRRSVLQRHSVLGGGPLPPLPPPPPPLSPRVVCSQHLHNLIRYNSTNPRGSSRAWRRYAKSSGLSYTSVPRPTEIARCLRADNEKANKRARVLARKGSKGTLHWVVALDECTRAQPVLVGRRTRKHTRADQRIRSGTCFRTVCYLRRRSIYFAVGHLILVVAREPSMRSAAARDRKARPNVTSRKSRRRKWVWAVFLEKSYTTVNLESIVHLFFQCEKFYVIIFTFLLFEKLNDC